MKTNFEKPICEVVYFNNDVIATSGCGCFVGGIDFVTNTTCTGANVSCSCSPNETDPNANCEPSN